MNKNIDPLIEDFQAEGHPALSGPGFTVFSVAYSPDGKTVVASASDGRIQFVDAASGERFGRLFRSSFRFRILGLVRADKAYGSNQPQGVSFSFENVPEGSQCFSGDCS